MTHYIPLLQQSYDAAVAGDKEKAFKLCLEAAEKGNPKAQQIVSVYYKTGIGTPVDEGLAATWMKISHFVVPKPDICEKFKDVEIEVIHQLAEKGDTEAMRYLAVCYAHGKRVKEDAVKALEYLTKSAELSDPEAMVGLGMSYKDGILLGQWSLRNKWEKVENPSFKQDYDLAVEWFLRASDYSHPRALHSLAAYYSSISLDDAKCQFFLEQNKVAFQRINPNIKWPFKSAAQHFFRNIVPRLMTCDRCGQVTYDTIGHATYTCKDCNITQILCEECQNMTINCSECGRPMECDNQKEKEATVQRPTSKRVNTKKHIDTIH